MAEGGCWTNTVILLVKCCAMFILSTSNCAETLSSLSPRNTSSPHYMTFPWKYLCTTLNFENHNCFGSMITLWSNVRNDFLTITCVVLSCAFPELKLNVEKKHYVSSGYWKEISNQKMFLENLAPKLSIMIVLLCSADAGRLERSHRMAKCFSSTSHHTWRFGFAYQI